MFMENLYILDDGRVHLHEADWHLIKGDIRLRPLKEGDLFECGGYRLETIEGEKHPVMPCRSYRGKWTEYLYEGQCADILANWGYFLNTSYRLQ